MALFPVKRCGRSNKNNNQAKVLKRLPLALLSIREHSIFKVFKRTTLVNRYNITKKKDDSNGDILEKKKQKVC